jgi:hypothetical protein
MVAGAGLAVIVFAGGASADPSQCDGVAGNLVQNCGFENGTLADWATNAHSGSVSVTGSFVNSGNEAGLLNASGNFGSAEADSTDFFLKSGVTYTVSFYAEQVSSIHGDGSLTVQVDDQFANPLNDGVCMGDPSQCDAAPTSFARESFQVTGNGAKDYLDVFLASDAKNQVTQWAVDDFSVVPLPVPEPSSWALFAAGLIAAGWFGFLHRRNSPAGS